MTVGVADEVRRSTVLAPDLDDLRPLVRIADRPTVHVQPVSHFRAHGTPSSGPTPPVCNVPPGAATPLPGRQPTRRSRRPNTCNEAKRSTTNPMASPAVAAGSGTLPRQAADQVQR